MTLRILMVLCLMFLVGCGSSQNDRNDFNGIKDCDKYLGEYNISKLIVDTGKPISISSGVIHDITNNGVEGYFRPIRFGLLLTNPPDNLSARGKVGYRIYLETMPMCGKNKDKPCVLLSKAQYTDEKTDSITDEMCIGSIGHLSFDLGNYYVSLYTSSYDSYSTNIVIDIPAKGRYFIPISVNQKSNAQGEAI